MGQITIEFDLRSPTPKQSELWEAARKANHTFVHIGAVYRITNTGITCTPKGPIGLIGAEEVDQELPQNPAIERLKSAQRLNAELQKESVIGSDIWHVYEDIDDQLHEALTLLGD